MNASYTCQTDTTPQTTVYRFASLCTSAHWHAIGSGAACYPSSMGPTAFCGCGTRTTNPGCSSSTCWRREISFTSYLLDPGWGAFVRVHHCFENGGNFYNSSGCNSYGDPTSIGYLATVPSGPFNMRVYVCEWYASGVREQFFTVTESECTAAGGFVVRNYYARP